MTEATELARSLARVAHRERLCRASDYWHDVAHGDDGDDGVAYGEDEAGRPSAAALKLAEQLVADAPQGYRLTYVLDDTSAMTKMPNIVRVL